MPERKPEYIKYVVAYTYEDKLSISLDTLRFPVPVDTFIQEPDEITSGAANCYVREAATNAICATCPLNKPDNNPCSPDITFAQTRQRLNVLRVRGNQVFNPECILVKEGIPLDTYNRNIIISDETD